MAFAMAAAPTRRYSSPLTEVTSRTPGSDVSTGPDGKENKRNDWLAKSVTGFKRFQGMSPPKNEMDKLVERIAQLEGDERARMIELQAAHETAERETSARQNAESELEAIRSLSMRQLVAYEREKSALMDLKELQRSLLAREE